MKILLTLIFALSMLMPAVNSAYSVGGAMSATMDHSSMQVHEGDLSAHDCCDEESSAMVSTSTITSPQPCHTDENCSHCAQHCFSTTTGLIAAVSIWQPATPERVLTAFLNRPVFRTEAFFKPPMHS